MEVRFRASSASEQPCLTHLEVREDLHILLCPCHAPGSGVPSGDRPPNATSGVTLRLVTPPFFCYCLLFLSRTLLTQPFHLKSGCCRLSGDAPAPDTTLWGRCSCPAFPAALPTLLRGFHLPDRLWYLHPRPPLGASREDRAGPAWLPC